MIWALCFPVILVAAQEKAAAEQHRFLWIPMTETVFRVAMAAARARRRAARRAAERSRNVAGE